MTSIFFSVIISSKINFLQILIKVVVAAVNPTDTWCRDGAYPEWSMKLYVPSFPWTPGRDVAGTVEKIGSKVTRVKVSSFKSKVHPLDSISEEFDVLREHDNPFL